MKKTTVLPTFLMKGKVKNQLKKYSKISKELNQKSDVFKLTQDLRVQMEEATRALKQQIAEIERPYLVKIEKLVSKKKKLESEESSLKDVIKQILAPFKFFVIQETPQFFPLFLQICKKVKKEHQSWIRLTLEHKQGVINWYIDDRKIKVEKIWRKNRLMVDFDYKVFWELRLNLDYDIIPDQPFYQLTRDTHVVVEQFKVSRSGYNDYD